MNTKLLALAASTTMLALLLIAAPTNAAPTQACAGTINLPPGPTGGSIYVTYPEDGVPGTLLLLSASGVSGPSGQLQYSNGAGGHAVYANDYDAPFGPLTLTFDQAGTLTGGKAFYRTHTGEQFGNWFDMPNMVVTCSTGTFSPADTDQNCIISFAEFNMARHSLLAGTGGITFADYSFARSALLNQDPSVGYDALAPESFNCTPA